MLLSRKKSKDGLHQEFCVSVPCMNQMLGKVMPDSQALRRVRSGQAENADRGHRAGGGSGQVLGEKKL